MEFYWYIGYDMTPVAHKNKIEFGDWQTPPELSDKICKKLVNLGVLPDYIIEPTCGFGSFLISSANHFRSVSKLAGLEVNENYTNLLNLEIRSRKDSSRFNIINTNFFNFDWKNFIKTIEGNILIVGNFPWVTNSQQSSIGGINLPTKNNFQNHTGMEAITGKSNFDISEWMLIETTKWLVGRSGYIAMLCKTIVARKILNYLFTNNRNLHYSALFGIDAKKYFNASVDACLLFCEFDTESHNYDYDVYENLNDEKFHRVGFRNGIFVNDISSFEKYEYLFGKGKDKWRSGVKHDCSDVMEFRKTEDGYMNGLGEIVDLEDIYLYPFLKGSDIANKRISNTKRFVLVTQRNIGESTELIKLLAPKTWNYLEKHSTLLENRKSRIYQKKPRFSIFGVGAYSFSPWKIAICGLYKKLNFVVVGMFTNKPVFFDDTVYFLSFNNEQDAYNTYSFISDKITLKFIQSMIFWDEKRPIKASILNNLNLYLANKNLEHGQLPLFN